MRAELLQEFHASVGEKDSGGSSGEGEDEAFGEQLAEQTGAPRSERGPNGNLALARGIAREKEARDVRASNQENQSDRGDEHHECGTHIADRERCEGPRAGR